MKHEWKFLAQLILLIILATWLSGCTKPFIPYTPSSLGTEEVFSKNYELHVEKRTFVGEPMIKVKNYYLSKSSAKAMFPNVDATITSRSFKYTFKHQEEYDITGQTVVDGKNFYLISIPTPWSAPYGDSLLISENGAVDGRSMFRHPLFGYHGLNLFEYKIYPADAIFVKKDASKVDSTQGYKNFELIYNGTDKKSLNITYREYSPDNFARTAFFQRLTYPADAKTIRFKQFEILVDEVTSQGISFTVIEDGLGK